MIIKELKSEEIISDLVATSAGARGRYAAMYSSWYGGITRDVRLMMLPIDDHGFHRGDAVFEAIKMIDGRIYALDAHLERMARSAAMIGLTLPKSHSDLRAIAIETSRVSGLRDAILRYYVSRGPGSFSPNPYESIGAQVYLVVTELKPVAEEAYARGVSCKVSSFIAKQDFFANIKSCNYLTNVLMKKEAVDAGVDFTVSCDESGNLAEGATENFAIISRDRDFLVPGFERTLRGVTVTRAMELAVQLVKNGVLRGIRHAQISVNDVRDAREAMFLGTTLDCLPVTRFEGHAIGSATPGPVAKMLRELLKQDMMKKIAG